MNYPSYPPQEAECEMPQHIPYPSDMPRLERQDVKPPIASRPILIQAIPNTNYITRNMVEVTFEPVVQAEQAVATYEMQTKEDSATQEYKNAQPTYFATTVSKPSKKSKLVKRVPGKRKPCHCSRSQCLKLYCDCFANGEFCLDCDCKDCHNNLEFNHERSRAIKQSLERNPNAFKPKIGVATKGKNSDMERLHQKGCQCKKSNCLKNYCECYEAKVACTDRCKCRSCRNSEVDRQVRFSDRFTVSKDYDRRSPPTDDEIDESFSSRNVRTHLWYYLTDDVVEATTSCLMAQAHESEERQDSQVETINSVFREFGSCLSQIFDVTRQAQKTHAAVMKKDAKIKLPDDEELPASKTEVTEEIEVPVKPKVKGRRSQKPLSCEPSTSSV